MAAVATSVAPVETPSYHAIPPAPGHTNDHAITTHMPGWELVLEFIQRNPDFFKRFVDMYPRFVLHKDIKKLTGILLEHTQASGQFCLLFPLLTTATACYEFVTAPKRPDGLESLPLDVVSIRAFELGALRLYALFFPADKVPLVMPFWSDTGVGISSRLAQECLRHSDSLRELPGADMDIVLTETESHRALRQRIAGLLERAPVGPPRQAKVSANDVYLYPTGMAAIFYVHHHLLQLNDFKSKTVMFGFPFHQTIHILEHFGPGAKFLQLGTEIDELETFLKSEAQVGKPVQAVWTEIPSNPLLVSSDLLRLRQLADKYRFVLVVDDTLGSACSIDVLPVADIIVTSLTKSFSGYSDAMGGSATLNPSSRLYPDLKSIFEKKYLNQLYTADAATLLRNSQDYLARSKILNDNAARIVDYLHSRAIDPASSLSKVYYPSVSPTRSNFDAFMRPETPDFTPGYGCLFSVEFDSLEAAIKFYENLHVHKGPHLGAHRTIALPYVKLLYNDSLDKAKDYGLKETQIRISTGLEDGEPLLETFKVAVRAADGNRD